MIRRNK